MERCGSYRSALAVAEASRVVSDSGKVYRQWEPEIISAGGQRQGDTPMPAATPMSAHTHGGRCAPAGTGSQEVMEQMMKARGRNIWD